MVAASRTNTSFALYRSKHQPERPMNSDVPRYDGDTDKMQPQDGLNDWRDGPVAIVQPLPSAQLKLSPDMVHLHLWVVTANQVLYAIEDCVFGNARGAGVVKHSNLTGGGVAFSGGELFFIDDETIAINGHSGRYRPRSHEEMKDIERAFVGSGYKVWSMGYNEDTNRPNVFFGITDLEWVSP